MYRRHRCIECGFLTKAKGMPRKYQSFHELRSGERNEIANNTHTRDSTFHITCARYVWDRDIGELSKLNEKRKCKLFFPHNPGYEAEEHKKLQEDAKTRRVRIIQIVVGGILLIIVTVIGLVFGT